MRRRMLALALALMLPAAALALTRQETVSAYLGPSGVTDTVWIENSLYSPEAVRVTDYGVYHSVRTEDSRVALTLLPDGVTFDMPAGHFSYVGTPALHLLPWRIRLGCSLDGRELLPSELPGVSGRLTLTLTVSQGDSRYDAFFRHCPLSATLLFPEDCCSSLQADGAMVRSVNGDTEVTWTAEPGGAGVLRITLDARNFRMADAVFTALWQGEGPRETASPAPEATPGETPSPTPAQAGSVRGELLQLQRSANALAASANSALALLQELNITVGEEGVSLPGWKALLNSLSGRLAEVDSALTSYTQLADSLAADAASLQLSAGALAAEAERLAALAASLSPATPTDLGEGAGQLHSGLLALQQQAALVSAEAAAMQASSSGLVGGIRPAVDAARGTLATLSALAEKLDPSDGGPAQGIGLLDPAIGLMRQAAGQINAISDGVDRLVGSAYAPAPTLVPTPLPSPTASAPAGGQAREDGPVSFTDPRNEVTEVSFRIILPGVEPPAAPTPSPAPTASPAPSFWEQALDWLGL